MRRPVHVDTASATGLAAKNTLMASELGGGKVCVGSGNSSFGPSMSRTDWSDAASVVRSVYSQFFAPDKPTDADSEAIVVMHVACPSVT